MGRLVGHLAKGPAIITSRRAIDIWQKPWQRTLDTWTLPSVRRRHRQFSSRRTGNRRTAGTPESPADIPSPQRRRSVRFRPGDQRIAQRHYRLPEEAVVGGTLMRLHREKGADIIPAFVARIMPDRRICIC